MAVNEKFFQWLDKLKSGNIQQGVGSLHKVRVDGEGNEVSYMCCLGVCSSMFADELGTKVRQEGMVFSYNNSVHYPNKDVLVHMGIPETHLIERVSGWSVLVSTPKDLDDRLGGKYHGDATIGVDVLNDNKYNHSEIAYLLRKEFAPETVEA